VAQLGVAGQFCNFLPLSDLSDATKVQLKMTYTCRQARELTKTTPKTEVELQIIRVHMQGTDKNHESRIASDIRIQGTDRRSTKKPLKYSIYNSTTFKVVEL